MTLEDQIKRDENLRLKPYPDSVGKLTVGYGRNLEDDGISVQEAEYLLKDDLATAISNVNQYIPWSRALDEVRFGVLVNMTFNMGIEKVLGFKNTLVSVKAGNYTLAAQQMLQSRWAMQVGARATRLSKQMLTGIWQ